MALWCLRRWLCSSCADEIRTPSDRTLRVLFTVAKPAEDARDRANDSAYTFSCRCLSPPGWVGMAATFGTSCGYKQRIRVAAAMELLSLRCVMSRWTTVVPVAVAWCGHVNATVLCRGDRDPRADNARVARRRTVLGVFGATRGGVNVITQTLSYQ